MKVLLIDDDPRVREDLELFLQPTFELRWASGSEQAMDILKAGTHLDAIILDLCLPPYLTGVEETEGLELLTVLRQDLAIDIPVLVLSSLPRAEAEASCIQRGARAYLEKPCSVRDLVACLAELVDGPFSQ